MMGMLMGIQTVKLIVRDLSTATNVLEETQQLLKHVLNSVGTV